MRLVSKITRTCIPAIALMGALLLSPKESAAKASSGQAKPGNCEHKFASRLGYEEQLQILLKDFPEFKVSEAYEYKDPNFEAWVYQRIDVVEPKNGEVVGNVQYRENKDSNNLHIYDMRVERSYRNQGVSKLLFIAILSQAGTIDTIRTRLGLQNFDAYTTALGNGASAVDAIKLTPAYKIRALAGFPHIIEDEDSSLGIDHDDYDSSVGFSVSR